jgi:hypothetical protein
MNLSQHAGYSFVPVISRLVLFAAFLPAGFHKVFHNTTFHGPQAQVLRDLGVGTPVAATGSAASATMVLASFQTPPEPAGRRPRPRQPRRSRPRLFTS